MKRYRERSIRFMRLLEWGDWKVKVYSISLHLGEVVEEEVLDLAWENAREYLASPRASVTAAGVDWAALPAHGAAFLTVHQGREAVFSLLDFWVDENILHHQTWVKPTGEGAFTNVSASGASACVWEMAVQIHEREAWLRHVYNRSGEADFGAYFADVLNGDV